MLCCMEVTCRSRIVTSFFRSSTATLSWSFSLSLPRAAPRVNVRSAITTHRILVLYRIKTSIRRQSFLGLNLSIHHEADGGHVVVELDSRPQGTKTCTCGLNHPCPLQN